MASPTPIGRSALAKAFIAAVWTTAIAETEWPLSLGHRWAT